MDFWVGSGWVVSAAGSHPIPYFKPSPFMIDLLQIATDVAGQALSHGAHAAASTNPIERIAGGFHVEVKTLLAQIVSLLLIFAALYFAAWKKVLAVLDERRNKIADGLQYAEEMKSKLADAERHQAETLKAAALEAKEITAQAQKTAKDIIEKTQADAQRRAEELIAQTRENLTLERKQMLAEVKEHASRMVALTAARVLGKELDAKEQARFVESAAKELTR
jgi:F-type H+-transporting ATPase subunit b